jgi:Alginate lyase
MRSAFLAFLLAVPVFAQQITPPATLAIDGTVLARVKKQQDPAILNAVRSEADHAVDQGPFSVMDKKETPPSGTKHDYMSLAPYWWPNPATPNGLPYVRRDGETNPQVRSITDHTNIFELEGAVHALALGYYFTGKEEYAARATLLLRTWFLDPATCMNPNLNYAQAVLGVNNGRGIGLIEMRDLPRVLDAITLLSGSASLTQADRDGLHKWFSTYIEWLQNSPNGRDESKSKNNHGSWYDQQLVGIALFLGEKDLARKVAETAKTKRIALQIKPDGSQPLELARTKSFSYSVFNLTALMRLAQEAQVAGVDLWSYRAEDGASLRAALDYLLPYAQGSKKWTYENLNGLESSSLTEPLLRAAASYHSSAYLEDAKKLEKNPTAEILLLEEQARETLAPR